MSEKYCPNCEHWHENGRPCVVYNNKEVFWKIRCIETGLYHTSNFSSPNKTGKAYPTIGSARNGWNSIKAQRNPGSNTYELVKFEATELEKKKLI